MEWNGDWNGMEKTLGDWVFIGWYGDWNGMEKTLGYLAMEGVVSTCGGLGVSLEPAGEVPSYDIIIVIAIISNIVIIIVIIIIIIISSSSSSSSSSRRGHGRQREPLAPGGPGGPSPAGRGDGRLH